MKNQNNDDENLINIIEIYFQNGDYEKAESKLLEKNRI